MSKTQRKRRLRRRQVATQRAVSTARTARAVAITGSLLTTAALVAAPGAMAADSDITLVKDIDVGSGSSYPYYAVSVGSTVFFSASDGDNDFELWKTDGTTGGTQLVREINPTGSADVGRLTVIGSTVYFTADDGDGRELWKTDGTSAGTVVLSDVAADTPIRNLNVVGDQVFFTVTTGEFTADLWKSDGTPGGTTLVEQVGQPGNDYASTRFEALGDTLYFTADDGTSGEELWKSDGTAAGTGLVTDLLPGTDEEGYAYGSSPSYLTVLDNTLVFSATGGDEGRELWTSDGTADGTVLVKDINPSYGSSPRPVATVGGTLYLSANDGTHGRELWKTDGTAGGTSLVANINPDSSTYGNGSSPQLGTAIGTTIYFAANDGVVGGELFRSDGTAAGTRLVADINTDVEGDYPASSYPSQLTNVGGSLFFNANDGTNGAELWKSNGTDAGTGMIADLEPETTDEYGYASPGPFLLAVNGPTLYLSADDGTTGRELFKTTATATPQPAAVNVTAPQISGSAVEGSRLTASTGTWATTGLTFAYQWFVDGSAVDGATRSSYRLGTRDVGKQVEVKVTASRAGYRSIAVRSSPTAAVADEMLTNQAPPAISGAAKVGSALTASTGTWRASELSYAYQWKVNGAPVAGATANRFVVPATALGKTVTVTVTASRSDLGSASSTSSPTARVAAGTLRSTTAPKVVGQAKVGKTLRAAPGAVSPAATRTTFQWLRNGKPIAGATKATYKLSKKNAGKKISVKVTYTRAGYAALVKVTKATAKVAR